MTKQIKWDFFACIALSIAAFSFILYRIFHVSFTMDEWGMWNDSISPGLEALITFQHKDSQSHFFQGLFAMPFLKYLPFNPAESVRIPSLLMFPIYAWSGLHLTKYFKNPIVRLLFFCSWICPQIVLEYFGLARGYAFLMAFSGASYVGLIEAYNPNNPELKKDRWTKFSILAAAISMLSILTFSYGYLMVSFLLLLRHYLTAKGTVWNRIAETSKRGSFVIWTGVALAIFYLPRYLILRHCQAMLDFGGTNNYVSDSFSTLLDCIAYVQLNIHHTLDIHRVSDWIVFGAFGLCVLNFSVYIVNALRNHQSLFEALGTPFALSSTVFFGIAVTMEILFGFLGMQFPLRRTTLYLWPIIVMMFGFAINEIKFLLPRIVCVTAMVGTVAYSMTTYNVNTVIETNGDSQNKEIANALCELAKDFPPGRPMVVGLTDCIRYTIWYYLEYEHHLAPAPQLQGNPIVKIFGDKVLLYSLSYGYPQPFPPIWHHFPFSPDYYLLSPYEPGQQPNARLMDTTPVREFKPSKAGIYKAQNPPEGNLGCKVENCMVCKMLYQMAGTQLQQ
jgi:hypothetical protein